MATEVRRVSNSIVCLRRASYQTCSYIVRSASGIVLIDAGMSSSGADVLAGLQYLDASPSEIGAILLTHWHNDHAAGARVAHDLSGAPVYYHRSDERFFMGAAGARGFRGWVSDLIPEWGLMVLAKGLIGETTPRAIAAQQFVQDGETVLDERALFAGDALAVINREIRFMARPVTLDLDAARRSMTKCLERRPHFVCPGHREPMAAAEAACDAMLRHLAAGGRWPLLG